MQLGVYSFGDIHPHPVTRATTSPAQRVADLLERIRLAEQVGLDFFGVGEHHRPDYAVSSPSTVLAAAAAQTQRIQLGSAVTVLSTEDPVRVYQQFATMDLISRGRIELVAGRGSFIESYALFGADLSDYDALYDEKISLLLRIDDGNPVTWSGRFRPPLNDATILPRPYDKPEWGEHLAISIATGGNPESSVRAGLLGLPVNYAIIGGMPARFAPLVDLYRRAFAQSERERTHSGVTISGMGFVADTFEQATKTFFRTGWIRCAGSPGSADFRLPTRRPSTLRPRAAAPTSWEIRSRWPNGSSICIPCWVTTGRSSRWTCRACRKISRCGRSNCSAPGWRPWCTARWVEAYPRT